MRELDFLVEGQRLTKNGDFSGIVKGSQQYLKCKFEFKGDEWRRYRIAAVFYKGKEDYAVPLELDGTCFVPDELSDVKCIKVKLIGVRKLGRIITNIELIEQEG